MLRDDPGDRAAGRGPWRDLADLPIRIFADGADLDTIRTLAAKPWIKGFTTNPTLMRKSGVTDYVAFAQAMLALVGDRSVSFEVFADDPDAMLAQARTIAGWGPNVAVKIPVMNTAGVFSGPLIRRLAEAGVTVNVTALCTLAQIEAVTACLVPGVPAIISVFAGRIADTGIDPVPVMRAGLEILADRPGVDLLWASPRELFNLVQAAAIGCPIITVTGDLLSKGGLLGKDLTDYSLETVAMFYRDAAAAGFTIPV